MKKTKIYEVYEVVSDSLAPRFLRYMFGFSTKADALLFIHSPENLDKKLTYIKVYE